MTTIVCHSHCTGEMENPR